MTGLVGLCYKPQPLVIIINIIITDKAREVKEGGEGKKGEGKGNGGPTYKGREGREKGEGGSPRLLRFPTGSRGARI